MSNAIKKIPTYPEDIQLATDLVDEWGRGFVAETDYKYEAANTEAFSAAMERRGLGFPRAAGRSLRAAKEIGKRAAEVGQENLTEDERRKLMTAESKYGASYYAYGDDSSTCAVAQ